MNNPKVYLNQRVRIGWMLVGLGVVLFAAGLAAQLLLDLPFNARIISGLGILFAGLGAGQVLRYQAASRDRLASARLVNEERDERSAQIRARAGNRAFWVSLALTYAALMWLSLAASGSLPEPSPDGLWFFLAAAVVLPMVVYIAGIVAGQRNS